MSGLLVKSTAFMQDNLKEFNKRGISVPVILGGAALTPKFVHEDCQNVYNGKVVYGRDAFSDLNFMDDYMPAKIAGEWDNNQGFLNGKSGINDMFTMPKRSEKIEEVKIEEVPLIEDTNRAETVSTDIPRATPPFWGSQIIRDIPLEELFAYLDLQALISGQWQFRKPKEQSRAEYDAFLAEKAYPVLEYWKKRILEENLLEPISVYGYFPVQAVGNTVHIYNPENRTEEISSFNFPRQRSLRRLCISDFYAPKELGIIDVMPLQAVTVGQIATDFAQSLFQANQYTDYLYFNGLAVQMAEAVAEWTHARIRKELGFITEEPNNIRDILAQRYRGSRYSFGYPACPNMQDQYKLLDLLDAKRVGLTMDESEQLHPEQSTTALVSYHPEARYFSA
jgi:5-methyltetrahydrofolate--homocysteine methyltransferase